ncbi:MAG: tape measure protein [Bacteroidetes bacterium]|nr:tape measure protein [Bacteroidota bacterium]
MNQRNKVLGQSYDELQKRIREVESTIKSSTVTSQISSARRELASLQRMAGKHQGNVSGASSTSSGGGFSVGGMALGGMIAGLALTAGTAFLGVVSGGIGTAISGSMAKEQAVTGLSTFLGKDQASTTYANIRKDAEISPYGTESLLGVNRALISAGLNAKDAREDTMNLANAIAAVGGGDAELGRMAANMQQIKTVGKATAMDIKQFGMVGVNIYEMLSKSTGKSIAEVKEMDVSYSELAKSLAMARSSGGIYAGALEAQGKTKSGRWNAVKDMAQNGLIDLGDAMSPIIIQFLDLGQKALSYVGPAILKITPYIDLISKGLGTGIAYLTGLTRSTGGWMDYLNIVSGIFGTIWDYSKTVSAQLGKIVGGILEWLGKSLIIKDIFRLIGWTLESIIKPVITWLGDALVWIWEKVLSPILDGLEAAYKWVRDIVTDDNNLTVEATKTIVNKDDPATPSYQADLTRFKDKGIISDTEAKSKKNKESSKKAGDTISSGGPRVINITLGKFFETIQFTTLNNNESRDELEKLLMEMMGRVLYNGAQNG